MPEPIETTNHPADGGPAWVKCPLCEGYQCRVHGGLHASDCNCAEVEYWEFSPYLERP